MNLHVSNSFCNASCRIDNNKTIISGMKEVRPKYQATAGGNVQVAEDSKPSFIDAVLSQKDISSFLIKVEQESSCASSDVLSSASSFAGDLTNLSDLKMVEGAAEFFDNLGKYLNCIF